LCASISRGPPRTAPPWRRRARPSRERRRSTAATDLERRRHACTAPGCANGHI
jgi:hypothetical protein